MTKVLVKSSKIVEMHPKPKKMTEIPLKPKNYQNTPFHYHWGHWRLKLSIGGKLTICLGCGGSRCPI